MKISRLLTIALLCSGSTIMAAVGDTLNLTYGYVADGVAATFTNGVMTFDKNGLQKSTRFYDSQKGWVAGSSYGDSYMCWAHTASNMIQYWQSYYGVFYKGDTALPYGSDYKRELYNKMNNSPVITDPMRINVMKALYNSGFSNMGGEVATGTNWFFTWVDSQGGYYSDYFGAIHKGQSNAEGQTATITGINSLSRLKTALLPALGITEANGNYTQTEAGLIAHLNVTDGSNPHTLTCYGLTTNDDGSIKSVIIADSDDCRLPSYEGTIGSTGTEGTYTPKLSQLYIKTDDDGKLMLYSDESCETQFISGYTYYVAGVTQINTPEVLKNMLAEYSSAEEALVWNGCASEWKSQLTDTNTLPDQSTGWDILVNGDGIEEQHKGYYHSYAEDNRAVLLDSHGMNGQTGTPRDITIVGTITPGSITVENGGNYRLKAGNAAAIAGSGDVRINKNGRLTSELSLGTRNITAGQGGHFSYALSSDTELSGKIAADSGGTVQFRNSSTSGDVSYHYTMNSRSLADATVQALRGKLIIGDEQDKHGTHLDLLYAFNSTLNLEELILYSGSSLNAYNDTTVTNTFSALRNEPLAATAPQMKYRLNLSQAHTLEMETVVDMDGNDLILGTSVKQLTLSNDMFPIIAYSESNELQAVLFTNIQQLNLGDEPVTYGSWAASSYFSHAAITNDTRLILEAGVLRLQGLSIPEPSGITLSLLALTALAARRRRSLSASRH